MISDMFEACALHILSNAERGLTAEEIRERVNDLSDKEQKDALARYQEYDPNP